MQNFFFTLANSEKKITSADLKDLLSCNMVVQLFSWSIIIYFPNPSDAAAVYQAIQNSKLSSTKQFKVKLHFEVIIARLVAVASISLLGQQMLFFSQGCPLAFYIGSTSTFYILICTLFYWIQLFILTYVHVIFQFLFQLGTHTELIRQNGLYAELVRRQTILLHHHSP